MFHNRSDDFFSKTLEIIVARGESFRFQRWGAADLVGFNAHRRRAHAPHHNFHLRAATAGFAADISAVFGVAVASGENPFAAPRVVERRGFAVGNRFRDGFQPAFARADFVSDRGDSDCAEIEYSISARDDV